METILIKAAQLILAFAILVIIHEFGHFFFARLFGIRVEKFYIFFDPWFEIFKWKPKKYMGFFGKSKRLPGAEDDSQDETKKSSFWGDTEYGIGWLPLGGYCKISGMIDESMDKEQMAQPAKPWEFRTKPAWQRLLVMIAGVLFNFLLAIVIYAGIVFATGEKYVPFRNAELGMMYCESAKEIGFQDGDIPLTADGKALDKPMDARLQMLEADKVEVLRNGTQTVTIDIPEKFIFTVEEEMKSGNATVDFMAYRIPAQFNQIVTGGAADKAGMKVGDRVLAINGDATPSLDIFYDRLKGHGNEAVDFTILRTAQNDTLHITATLSEHSKLGVGLEVDPSNFYAYEEKTYNIFQSIPRGCEMGVERLSSYASSMKHVFSKEGAESIGGFGSIGSIFPEKWNWLAFWNIAAFLSVALAFMNILPIPALDGGHVLFLLYEVITRRKPSEKFMEWAQMIGMGLIFLLLIYANGMDIIRLFK
ncbi:MAG: RIP metalloprotease RseP [Muribaculaceae bacterium]|nr:RIP metalloprotease RseP [Muribaculaceae bacterium]